MICSEAKDDCNPIKLQFNVVPPDTKTLETVYIDLLSIQNEKYLTIVDVSSRYAQVSHIYDRTAISVVKALLTFNTQHRLPLTIVSENGAVDIDLTKHLMQQKLHSKSERSD